MHRESTTATPKSKFRVLLYGLFVVYIGVNLFEGVLTNQISGEQGFEFNYAISSVLDAIFRVMIAVGVLFWSKSSICKCFQSLTWALSLKTLFARILIQTGEVLTTMGMAYLVASTAQVINQARIPLVGLLGYFILCKCLTRDQTIYAIAILPLAAQFNLLGADPEGKSKNEILGYFMCAFAVVFLSVSNVLVEKLLKKDYAHLPTWDQQLLFAIFDLPVMCVIYCILTWFEKEIVGVETRSWNPFDSSNMNHFHWIVALAANGAIWGFTRLCILSYEGAMWLNLSTVLVMGLMWSSECVENKIFKNKNTFDINKFLCLLSLSCILVGYELASRKKTEEKSESTVEEPMI